MKKTMTTILLAIQDAGIEIDYFFAWQGARRRRGVPTQRRATQSRRKNNRFISGSLSGEGYKPLTP
jgi:hypothetical protein